MSRSLWWSLLVLVLKRVVIIGLVFIGFSSIVLIVQSSFRKFVFCTM